MSAISMPTGADNQPFDWSFSMNRAVSITKRSWTPSPMEPYSSKAFTLNTNRLRSTSTNSLSHHTRLPIGVAEV